MMDARRLIFSFLQNSFFYFVIEIAAKGLAKDN